MLIQLISYHANRKAGSVSVIVAIALVALLGAAALTFDIGHIVVAAQRVQQVADVAALAGGSRPILAAPLETRCRVNEIVVANNEIGTVFVRVPEQVEVVLYGPGEVVPDFRVLSSQEEALSVTAYCDVPMYFARIFGLENTTVWRRAMVARVFAPGAPIVPMWISNETPLNYDEPQELHLGADASAADIPGTFGWLEPLSGSNDFLTLLKGYDVPEDMRMANYIECGETVTGYTGESVGLWQKALGYAPDGTGRLQRAEQAPWADQTWETYTTDNPRLLIVPMVDYLGGSGSNAEFYIVRFGVFWLEELITTGPVKSIRGRFIEFNMPGTGSGLPDFATGLWTVKLVG